MPTRIQHISFDCAAQLKYNYANADQRNCCFVPLLSFSYFLEAMCFDDSVFKKYLSLYKEASFSSEILLKIL